MIGQISKKNQQNQHVHFAIKKDLDWLKQLTDCHRHELGFTNRAILAKAITKQEILCIPQLGFLHFHHRRDQISTLYHLCVDHQFRFQGYGRLLLTEWEAFSRQTGIKRLRLKCPIDLQANGFYDRLGWRRVSIESGKLRSLVVWEKPLLDESLPKPQYIASLSASRREIEKLKQDWHEGVEQSSSSLPNPFESVIFSPLTCPDSTTAYFKQQKLDSQKYPNSQQHTRNIWIDCGAYQVQQGKYTYEELLEFLHIFYQRNQWADGYVLPDIVPLSSDSADIVNYKVRDTIFYCQRFFDQMPSYIQARAIAPVQGQTVSQVSQCIEAYARLGIQTIGFGSWGTSGKNGSVNMLSKAQLKIFDSVLHIAKEYQMKVHCFGIGGINSLKRLKAEKLLPHSLDSTSWWKAGGFGKIFLPEMPQIHITVRRSYQTTRRGFEELKNKTHHSCYFCQNIKDLRNSRKHRIMHNLTVWLQALQ